MDTLDKSVSDADICSAALLFEPEIVSLEISDPSILIIIGELPFIVNFSKVEA